MPLVFAVLLILALFIKDPGKSKYEKQRAESTYNSRRKTNATLEQKTLDSYMKKGIRFDEAFSRTAQDMVSAGFVPCIQKKEYGHISGSYEYKGVKYYEEDHYESSTTNLSLYKYDSEEVNERRKFLEREWRKTHTGKYNGEYDDRIYENFPETDYEYYESIHGRTLQNIAMEVGEVCRSDVYGVCQIVDREFSGKFKSRGTYILKVLDTGKTIRVNMESNSIHRA